MNTNILQKCLDELKNPLKENIRVDYVIGMLETLIEMNDPLPTPKKILPTAVTNSSNINLIPPELRDEADILDAKARAALERVKQMSTE